MHQEKFLEYLRVEKRYSERTLVSYGTDLRQFKVYLKDFFETEEITDVNHMMIRSWIVELIENEISTKSVNRKIATLNTYYKFLLKEQKIELNPMLKIIAPKMSKRLPVFVEEKAMEELFEEMEFADDFNGVLDKLVLELFYATGIRLSELINIKRINVDQANSSIKVLGKRNKERIIPINKLLLESIRDFELKKGEIEIIDPEYLFVDALGKKLYEKKVYRIVTKYLNMVTTLSKKSPHVLRHTFATHMLNNGADINAIKELLGHANLAATQVYASNSIERLKNVHKQAHPRG
ncbi:MAG: tyrosine-type recombinase/integrase [Flavobacteriales bacterium]|nr:tyrosine-type recombinase/integrase [Flavobacteriales bacterium]